MNDAFTPTGTITRIGRWSYHIELKYGKYRWQWATVDVFGRRHAERVARKELKQWAVREGWKSESWTVVLRRDAP